MHAYKNSTKYVRLWRITDDQKTKMRWGDTSRGGNCIIRGEKTRVWGRNDMGLNGFGGGRVYNAVVLRSYITYVGKCSHYRNNRECSLYGKQCIMQ